MQKKTLLILPILLIFQFISCKSFHNDFSYDETNFDDRSYELTVPSDYNVTEKHSLLFVFHGSGGTGEGMKALTLFDDYAEEKNVIICYPDAAVENWEEGCRCNKAYRLGINDIGFVDYLIKKLSGEYRIDSTKIFGVGYSQGGLFAMNVACKLSDKFAAVATVASTMSVPLMKECKPSESISVLMIHGTQDRVLPFNGLDKEDFSLVSSPEAIKFWAKVNGCEEKPVRTKLLNAGIRSVGVTKHEYRTCNSGERVILYEIVNGGHLWFAVNEFDATREIIEYFYSR